MASEVHQLHFILFPLMAPGHMIPIVDIAKLLAKRGAKATVVTTPLNANRFSSTINRAIASGLKIQVIELDFPSVEAGLPQGCENLDSLPSLDMASNFFLATNLLQQQLEPLMVKLEPKPSCIISDMGFPWTTKIAEKFDIPRFVFHGTCCFSLFCNYNIFSSGVLQTVNSDSEFFVVPGLPDQIELTKAQVSGSTNSKSDLLKDLTEQIMKAEKTSYGVIVNSFEELEPEYVKLYREVKKGKVWCVGPVSFCNKDDLDMAERGNKTSIDTQVFSNWLDKFEPRSVVYASLGSLARLTAEQMAELALGLEASNRPFIWALGNGDNPCQKELEKWISENGFEERTKERALLIRGWAPQVLILSHHSIGGFLTHCGWNSTLEGISSGVPMVTWPMFAEQFCNEKLVVKVLKIGVRVGVKVPVKWGEEEKVGVLVKNEDVKEALERVMDEGEEGQERRKRAEELGKIAKRAVEEGGSSYSSLALLMKDIMKN